VPLRRVKEKERVLSRKTILFRPGGLRSGKKGPYLTRNDVGGIIAKNSCRVEGVFFLINPEGETSKGRPKKRKGVGDRGEHHSQGDLDKGDGKKKSIDQRDGRGSVPVLGGGSKGERGRAGPLQHEGRE